MCAAKLWLCAIYLLAACEVGLSLTCKTTTVSLGGTLTESEYETQISTSGSITTTPRFNLRGPLNTGYSKVDINVCLEGGKWKVAGYSIGLVMNDLTLVVKGSKADIQPRNGRRGFGISIPRVTTTTVYVDTMVCVKVPTTSEKVLGAVGFLNSIPWPGKYTGIAQFVLGLGISIAPSPTPKYKCGRLGVQRAVPWKLNSATGVATITLPTSGQYIQSAQATWQNPCTAYRYCGTTHEQTVRLTKGPVGRSVTG